MTSVRGVLGGGGSTVNHPTPDELMNIFSMSNLSGTGGTTQNGRDIAELPLVITPGGSGGGSGRDVLPRENLNLSPSGLSSFQISTDINGANNSDGNSSNNSNIGSYDNGIISSNSGNDSSNNIDSNLVTSGRVRSIPPSPSFPYTSYRNPSSPGSTSISPFLQTNDFTNQSNSNSPNNTNNSHTQNTQNNQNNQHNVEEEEDNQDAELALALSLSLQDMHGKENYFCVF